MKKKTECAQGTKFGYWTVISPESFMKKDHAYVTCRCKCGKEQDICLSDLKNGRSLGCRSCRAADRRVKINIGEKYQHWTVIGGPKTDERREIKWECQCDCGNIRWIGGNELKNPNKHIQCQECSLKESKEKILLKNGKTGELALTRFNKIKRNAEVRNIPFDVSIQFLGNLFEKQNHICAITGDVISSIDEASLDRIDSSKGYTEDNVQWVTIQANLSKHTMTMEELKLFCKKVLNHANQQPSIPLTKDEGSETNS